MELLFLALGMFGRLPGFCKIGTVVSEMAAMHGHVSRIAYCVDGRREWREIGPQSVQGERVVNRVTHCRECGYSLDGLHRCVGGVVCPECGRYQNAFRPVRDTPLPPPASRGARAYMFAFLPCSLILTFATVAFLSRAFELCLLLALPPFVLAALGSVFFAKQRVVRRRLWRTWFPLALVVNVAAAIGLLFLAVKFFGGALLVF